MSKGGKKPEAPAGQGGNAPPEPASSHKHGAPRGVEGATLSPPNGASHG